MPPIAKHTSLPRPDPTNVATKVKYRGVRKRQSGRYAAEIWDKKQKSQVWLGTFDTAVEAAHAYDKKALELYGDKAKLNFPIRAELNLPIPDGELTNNNNNSVVRNPTQGSTLEFSSPPPLDLTLVVSYATSIMISSIVVADANAAAIFPVAHPLTFFDAFTPIPAHAAKQGEENSDSSSSSIVYKGRVPGPNLLDLDLNAPPPPENA